MRCDLRAAAAARAGCAAVETPRGAADNEAMKYSFRFRRALSLAVLLPVVAGGAACSQRSARTPAWEPMALGTDAEIEDVCFSDSLNGWIVGGGWQIEGGLVGRTRDGGRTWTYTSGLATKEPGVFRFGIEAVQFFDSTRGIVASDGGKIFVTDDGGANWRLTRYGRSSADHIFDLDFVDRWNGWAVGLGGVLRTTDGGENWTDVSRIGAPGSKVSGHAIHFIDRNAGWLVGQFGSLMRTSDGGESWEAVPTPLGPSERPYLFDLCFPDPKHGWVVGDEGTILHTADGGFRWVRQETGLRDAKSAPKLEYLRRGPEVDTLDLGERTSGLFLTAVRFIDERHGWAVGHYPNMGRSVVLRTEDGGAHWKVDAEVAGEELRALFMLDADHGWTVGDRTREGTQVILRRAGATGSGSS